MLWQGSLKNVQNISMDKKTKTKKTLILFSSLFETGGIQRYNKHLCDALSREFPDNYFTAVLLNPVGVKDHDRWANVSIKFIKNIPGQFFKKVMYVFYSIMLVLINSPRFIICAHPGLSPITFYIKKIFKIKYAVLTHGTDVWSLDGGLKLKALKNADLVVTVSRYTKDIMISSGISSNEINIIPDTVDLSLFTPKPLNENMKRRFQADKNTIIFTAGRISSLERYKGHDLLLEVMRELDKNFIWIVSGEGDDRLRLTRKAEKYGLNSRVHFLGRVGIDDLVDYYNLCDIFVMPSTGEGFGIVFLEAMACGKPVIGGGVDGSREPLMDGNLGYMVDPGNADEIATVIRKVISEKEKRNDPDFLRDQVRINFGIKSFQKKVKDVFKVHI